MSAHASRVGRCATALALALCSACASVDAPQRETRQGGPPIRFLLTFDDGPSTWEPYNPTRAILERLARNPVQPGIKAVFFVQTRDARAGGAPAGGLLMRQMHREGHLLALHNGSTWGHVSHVHLGPDELAETLADGRADIRAISGRDPILVRPPYSSYTESTLAAYRHHRLSMLLTDIDARDGKIYGWNVSLRRRSHVRAGLDDVRRAIDERRLPAIDGSIPVVVTFHDTNTFTARHMQEYLQILTQEALRAGLQLADPPFYAERGGIERAARARTDAGTYIDGSAFSGASLPHRLRQNPASD